MTREEKVLVLVEIYKRLSPEQRQESVPYLYELLKSIYKKPDPKRKPKPTASFSTIMKRLIAMDEEQQRERFLAHGTDQPPAPPAANNVMRRGDVRKYLQLPNGTVPINDEQPSLPGPTSEENES